MAANVVQLSETNGTIAGATVTDNISNMNFGSVDAPNLVAANHKIIIGTNSFLKWIRFKLVTNNNTSDSDIRVALTAGAYVTGEVIGGNISTSSGLVGQVMTTYGHSDVNVGGGAISPFPYAGSGMEAFNRLIAATPVPTSTPGTENLTIGGAAGGSLTVNGTYSDYMGVQNSSTSSTPAGAANTKTFTFTYNEI